METPRDEAGRVTEKVMIECFTDLGGPATARKLDTSEYNRLYEALYRALKDELEHPF